MFVFVRLLPQKRVKDFVQIKENHRFQAWKTRQVFFIETVSQITIRFNLRLRTGLVNFRCIAEIIFFYRVLVAIQLCFVKFTTSTLSL